MIKARNRRQATAANCRNGSRAIVWRQVMNNIIVIEDKAKNVFKYIALVSKHKGHLTLKELKAQAQSAK